MNYLIITLIILIIIIETSQQVFFKMAGKYPDKKIIYSLLAISMYVLFVFIWLRILKTVPLNIALPIMGLDYVAVAAAGRIFFKEKISIKKCAGIALIISGFLLVCYGGADFL